VIPRPEILTGENIGTIQAAVVALGADRWGVVASGASAMPVGASGVLAGASGAVSVPAVPVAALGASGVVAVPAGAVLWRGRAFRSLSDIAAAATAASPKTAPGADAGSVAGGVAGVDAGADDSAGALLAFVESIGGVVGDGSDDADGGGIPLAYPEPESYVTPDRVPEILNPMFGRVIKAAHQRRELVLASIPFDQEIETLTEQGESEVAEMREMDLETIHRDMHTQADESDNVIAINPNPQTIDLGESDLNFLDVLRNMKADKHAKAVAETVDNARKERHNALAAACVYNGTNPSDFIDDDGRLLLGSQYSEAVQFPAGSGKSAFTTGMAAKGERPAISAAIAAATGLVVAIYYPTMDKAKEGYYDYLSAPNYLDGAPAVLQAGRAQPRLHEWEIDRLEQIDPLKAEIASRKEQGRLNGIANIKPGVAGGAEGDVAGADVAGGDVAGGLGADVAGDAAGDARALADAAAALSDLAAGDDVVAVGASGAAVAASGAVSGAVAASGGVGGGINYASQEWVDQFAKQEQELEEYKSTPEGRKAQRAARKAAKGPSIKEPPEDIGAMCSWPTLTGEYSATGRSVSADLCPRCPARKMCAHKDARDEITLMAKSAKGLVIFTTHAHLFITPSFARPIDIRIIDESILGSVSEDISVYSADCENLFAEFAPEHGGFDDNGVDDRGALAAENIKSKRAIQAAVAVVARCYEDTATPAKNAKDTRTPLEKLREGDFSQEVRAGLNLETLRARNGKEVIHKALAGVEWLIQVNYQSGDDAELSAVLSAVGGDAGRDGAGVDGDGVDGDGVDGDGDGAGGDEKKSAAVKATVRLHRFKVVLEAIENELENTTDTLALSIRIAFRQHRRRMADKTIKRYVAPHISLKRLRPLESKYGIVLHTDATLEEKIIGIQMNIKPERVSKVAIRRKANIIGVVSREMSKNLICNSAGRGESDQVAYSKLIAGMRDKRTQVAAGSGSDSGRSLVVTNKAGLVEMTTALIDADTDTDGRAYDATGKQIVAGLNTYTDAAGADLITMNFGNVRGHNTAEGAELAFVIGRTLPSVDDLEWITGAYITATGGTAIAGRGAYTSTLRRPRLTPDAVVNETYQHFTIKSHADDTAAALLRLTRDAEVTQAVDRPRHIYSDAQRTVYVITRDIFDLEYSGIMSLDEFGGVCPDDVRTLESINALGLMFLSAKSAERFGGGAGWTRNTVEVSASFKAAHAVRGDAAALADLVAGELSRLGVRDRLGGSALVRFRVCDGSKQPRWQNLFVVGKAGDSARNHIGDVFGVDVAALEIETITEFAG
jgi:uncharacterized protein YueI